MANLASLHNTRWYVAQLRASYRCSRSCRTVPLLLHRLPHVGGTSHSLAVMPVDEESKSYNRLAKKTIRKVLPAYLSAMLPWRETSFVCARRLFPLRLLDMAPLTFR
jgi:hypothetical protein